MSAIFLSTESQSPAAQMIIDCFIEIQQNMDIVSLDKYTDLYCLVFTPQEYC